VRGCPSRLGHAVMLALTDSQLALLAIAATAVVLTRAAAGCRGSRPSFRCALIGSPIKAKLAEFFYLFGTKSVLFGACPVNPCPEPVPIW
jgi:hypothetical protein